jgi:hypothetical protein
LPHRSTKERAHALLDGMRRLQNRSVLCGGEHGKRCVGYRPLQPIDGLAQGGKLHAAASEERRRGNLPGPWAKIGGGEPFAGARTAFAGSIDKRARP